MNATFVTNGQVAKVQPDNEKLPAYYMVGRKNMKTPIRLSQDNQNFYIEGVSIKVDEYGNLWAKQ